MNRRLMLWALLVGSVIGLGEALAETAAPSWAESVGDHWIGLLAMSLVVLGFWGCFPILHRTDARYPAPSWAGGLVLRDDWRGSDPRRADRLQRRRKRQHRSSLSLLQHLPRRFQARPWRAGMEAGGLAALDHLDCHSGAARRHRAGRTALGRGPLPKRLLHVFLFAGPFALALCNWRIRPVAT